MRSGMKMMAVNEMRRRRDSRGRFMEGGQGGQMEMGYGRMEGGQQNQSAYSRREGGGRSRMEGGGSGSMGGYDRMESEMRGGGGRMESEMRRGGGGNRNEDGGSNRMEGGGASGNYWPGPHMPPYGDEPQRKIGFGANRSEAEMGGYGRMEEEPSMRRRRDSRGRYMEGGGNQQEMQQGNVSYFPQQRTSMHHGGSSGDGQKVEAGGTFWMVPPAGHEKLTREKAEKWVRTMKGDDPKARGEMWTYEDAKKLAEERELPTEGQEMLDFYVALNMVYNDYCKVAKEHGVDTEDYYADLAQAWLYDRDGKPPTEKLMAYKKYVVPHGEE